MKALILPLQPVYAQGIIDGTKKVEFRRNPIHQDVEKLYIYAADPIKMILGYFTLTSIIEDRPENLWERFKSVGGIYENDFFTYFKDVATGYSLVIDQVILFETPIDPIDFIRNYASPQSYIYLD